MLQTCRADPHLDAPLVHALIAATDPETGQALSDDDICNDLLIFMLAGHDTTATALTYALWALGHHRDVQDRVAAEAAEFGDRELTPDDVPRLGYTVQVLARGAQIAAARRGGRAAWRSATSRSVVTASRRAPSWPWGSTPCIGILPCGTVRWSSIPTGSARKTSKGRDRWQFIPFIAGPRSCIGEHFAMLETTLAMATIVRSLEIRSVDEDFPVAVPFTTVADGPIRATVRPRTRRA